MGAREQEDIYAAVGRLAYLSGIEYQSEPDVKVNMLVAMGILDNKFNLFTDNEEEKSKNLELVNQLITDKEDSNFLNILHHVPILRQNKKSYVDICLPDGVDHLKWNLCEQEDPRRQYKGEAALPETEKIYNGETDVSDLELVLDGPDETHRQIGNNVYRKYRFRFPFDISFGYHQVEFSYVDRNGTEVVQKSRLISAPEKCYDGLGIRDGKKTWGVPVQLYEQVSENNIGIGNYSDLAHLGYILGKNGAGLIGVNPLHASHDDQPENASPYAPDSRRFYNYIYVDVTAIPEFKNSPDIQAYYYSPEFQEKINCNKRRTYVDYQTTQKLVDDIMHKCYYEFKHAPSSKEARNRFKVYCDDMDGDLDKFATFRALSKHFAKQNPAPVIWTDWPEEYKNPNSEAVREFYGTHKEEIEYYKYTQWICESQLDEVKHTCLDAGMKIGLYMDTAVGASPRGYEAWCHPDLYLKGTAGAEADELSQNGQRWELLGFNPAKLQAEGYEPYRKILEAGMKYAGCLRIDHVLQLNRLYMFPGNHKRGTYVYYNTEEIMAIVVLESHRHKTMIIGEDLGNTTEKFRQQMEEFGIMSYKVLPFERKCDCYGSMIQPHEYPQLSVCATSTHDTPTLINQWNVQDVWQKKMLGIISEEQANNKFQQYASQRQAMNYSLDQTDSWHKVGGEHSPDPEHMANEVPEKYLQATADWMAQSNSAIMLMPFSDIFGMREMGNVPGTSELAWSNEMPLLDMPNEKCYINWRKKMHIPVEHMENVKNFKEISAILTSYRPDGNDGKGRYYQFERMGANKPSTFDFVRGQRLFNILKNREDYRFSTLISHRYNENYKSRRENRRVKMQNHYDQMKNSWHNIRNLKDGRN